MPTDDWERQVAALRVPPPSPVDAEALWETAQGRRRRRRIGSVALTAVVVVGIGVAGASTFGRDGESNVQTNIADDGTSTTAPSGDGDCGATAERLLDPATDVVLYLQPDATSVSVMDKADALRSRSEVAEVTVLDKQTVYSQFRQVFADQPQIVETVSPEILPWQVEVDLTNSEEIAVLDFVLSEELAAEQESLQSGGNASLVREVVARSEISSTIGPCEPTNVNEDTTTTTTAVGQVPTAGDEQLIDSFLRFAADPTAENLSALPLASEVSLGLGSDLVAVRSTDSLADRSAWEIELPGGAPFRAYTGPFSAIDVAGRASNTTVSLGEHPHCASPPVSPPESVAGLRRVSVQGDSASDDQPSSCLSWFTVDFFLTEEGQISAITLDLWEP